MLQVYKASAGSGKTYTLVREYIRLALKEPSKFRNILAITFTNKAANEMKERIVSTLRTLSTGGNSKLAEQLADSLDVDLSVITEQAGKVLSSILHQYSDFNVSTIDSFVHSIVRAYAYDLKLSSGFEVEMDSDKLLRVAVDLMLEEIGPQNPDLTEALWHFTDLKMQDGKSWSIEDSLINLGKELFVEDAAPFLDELAQYDRQQMLQTQKAIRDYQRSVSQHLFATGKEALKLIQSEGLSASDFYQGNKGVIGFFSAYAQENFPNNPEGNTHVQSALREDKWYTSKVSHDVQSRIENIKPRLTNYLKECIGFYTKEKSDYILADLILRDYSAFTLLNDLVRILQKYLAENDLVHISEFQKRIHKIVKEQEAPIIYERIGERFDNLMIDEHQDTSVLQWRNLLPLIENTQFKLEDSLVVGDGKQAIYRFRNGKVEQFVSLPNIYGANESQRLKEREVAIQNYGVDCKVLEYNYRSRSEVIKFNNELYACLSELPELVQKEIYANQAQLDGRNADGGFVQIEFWEKDKEVSADELRKLKVKTYIDDALSHGYQYRDIAVLTNNNLNGSRLANFLMQQGVPVVSSESLLINHSPQVKLILATLHYLNQSGSETYKAELAYYLHKVKGDKLFEPHLWNYRTTNAQFEEKISTVVGSDFVGDRFAGRHVADIIRELVDLFKLDINDASVQFFIDELQSFTYKYLPDISEFIDWWNDVKLKKSIVSPDSMNAVRVMTVHKSKGLEFPVVILPDADWSVRTSKRHWVHLNKSWLPNSPLVIISQHSNLANTELSDIYHAEQDSSFLDVLNLLYVATTRAEDRLYILSSEGTEKSQSKKSVADLLVHFLNTNNLWQGYSNSYSFGNAQTKSELHKTDPDNLFRLTKYPARNQFTFKPVQEDSAEIVKGNLIHSILKQVLVPKDAENILKRVLAEESLDAVATKEIDETVKSVLSLPQLQPYYDAKCKVLNERAMFVNGKVLIPDRVVMRENELVIIDYKTGAPRDEHKKQVQEYANALSTFTKHAVRKLIVYTSTLSIVEV